MPNKVVGMRMDESTLQRIESMRKNEFMSNAEVFHELVMLHRRLCVLGEVLRVGIERDGNKLIWVRNPATNEGVDVLEGDDAERVLLYIVEELNKPFWSQFKNFDWFCDLDLGLPVELISPMLRQVGEEP